MILVFKQCLKDLDTITYPFSYSAKILTNYQKERLEQMEISTIYSNRIISEMFKVPIKIKQVYT